MAKRIRNTRVYKKWLELERQRAEDGHPDKVEGLAVPYPPPPADGAFFGVVDEDPNAAAEKRNHGKESSGEDLNTTNVLNTAVKKSPEKITRKATKAVEKKKSTRKATTAAKKKKSTRKATTAAKKKKKKTTMKTKKAKNGKKKKDGKAVAKGMFCSSSSILYTLFFLTVDTLLQFSELLSVEEATAKGIRKDLLKSKPEVFFNQKTMNWQVKCYPDTELRCAGCDYSGNSIHRHLREMGLVTCEFVKQYNEEKREACFK